MAKKYFWLKLMNDFFQQPKMKKLRKLAGGDTFTIIYLKMQLLSLKTGGKLYFDGVEETFAEELALTIDEDEDNVLFVLMYLQKQGLIEQLDEREFALPETMQRIGSEADSTERVRRLRERKKEAQAIAAQGVEALPPASGASQCNGQALQCNAHVTTCNTEIDIEIDKDIEIEKEREGEEDGVSGDKPAETAHTRKRSSRFVPPTVEEVRAYCKERGNTVNAERFHAYYTASKWYRGKTKITDWKACVRTWEQGEKEKQGTPAGMQAERGRVKTEAEHAQGGHASGFGW